MRIIPLKDGDFHVNKNKEFILLNSAENRIGFKVAVQPFLVIIDDEYMLLDAGLGMMENGISKIYTNMAGAGLRPDAITKVLLSHLHKDHINGLIESGSGEFRLAFPQARVYMQRREYEYALTKKESLSYEFEKLDFLVNNADIFWLNDNEGTIIEEVTYQVTGGHTPFHQVFWIRSDREIAFYGADNLPQSNYLKVPAAYKADDDGKKAMQLRIAWEQQAKAQNWQLLLYHDLQAPIVILGD